MNPPASSNISSTLDTLKEDVQSLARDTAKQAHERIFEPATSLLQNAQQAVQQGAKRTQKVISEKLDGTRKAMSEGMIHTKVSAARLRDRVSDCISANPFASVGIAFITGVVLNSISRIHRG